jgi:hypothetical protein
MTASRSNLAQAGPDYHYLFAGRPLLSDAVVDDFAGEIYVSASDRRPYPAVSAQAVPKHGIAYELAKQTKSGCSAICSRF